MQKFKYENHKQPQKSLDLQSYSVKKMIKYLKKLSLKWIFFSGKA